MAVKDGGQGPKKIPWLLRPIGDGKPWPFAKGLRAMAVLCVGIAALILIFVAWLRWPDLSPAGVMRFDSFKERTVVGILFNVAWFAAIGVASLLAAAKGTLARRLALKALCVGTIACSAALCVLFYFVDRHLVMLGLLGFAYPPIILNWMKKNREV